jgi:hypothetical protein
MIAWGVVFAVIALLSFAVIESVVRAVAWWRSRPVDPVREYIKERGAR